MTTIYKIKLTSDQVKAVNSGTVVPAYQAMLNVMFGAENFKESDFKFYSKVGSVDTDDLEEAFRLANGNVGDIFQQGDRFYMVDTFGFKNLYFFEDELA